MSTLFRADRWRPLPEKCVKRRGQRLFTASFCQFNLYYAYYAVQSAITHCNSLCSLSISLQTVVIILVYHPCNAYNEPWDPGWFWANKREKILQFLPFLTHLCTITLPNRLRSHSILLLGLSIAVCGEPWDPGWFWVNKREKYYIFWLFSPIYAPSLFPIGFAVTQFYF